MKKKQLFILLLIGANLSVILLIILRLPSDPDKTELDIYFRAVNAYEQADFILCKTLTESLQKGNPSFFQAGLLKAKAEFFSDDFDSAEITLKKLLRKKKNYYEAEIWLMRCYFQLGQNETSVETGEELLSRTPEDPRVLGMLGRIYAVNEEYQKAIEYLGRSLFFEEELAINRIELAKIYSRLLNPEQASVNLNKAALLLDDDSPLLPAVLGLQRKMENYK